MNDSNSSNGSNSPPSHLQGNQLNQSEQQQTNIEQEQQEQQQELEDENNELDSSFFPSPSHYYKLYTTANLALPSNTTITIPTTSNSTIGEEVKEINSNDLLPPNPDWIIEHGSYAVFGETWPVEEVLPTLSDLGVVELFARDSDRSSSLLVLLRALLLNYTSLISSLLSPPPSLLSKPPTTEQNTTEPERTDPERLVEQISLISVNMHHLVNELRPVQARETLKNMMRSQIESRRIKTLAIKSKIASLKSTLNATKDELGNKCYDIENVDVTMDEDSDSEQSYFPSIGTTSSKKKSLSDKEKLQLEFERLKEAVDLLGKED